MSDADQTVPETHPVDPRLLEVLVCPVTRGPLTYDRAKTPDNEMVEMDDLTHVLQLLDKMDTREATILRMRFGLGEEEPKTLKEIGERLGLTRERVRQIESEALSKLADALQAE